MGAESEAESGGGVSGEPPGRSGAERGGAGRRRSRGGGGVGAERGGGG